jgi:hypothetical protein
MNMSTRLLWLLMPAIIADPRSGQSAGLGWLKM